MKLLIDIDENDYELLNKTGITLDLNTVFHGKEKDREMTFAIFSLTEALKNGTPVYEQERPHGEWEEPFEHNGKIYHRCNHCHISTPLMLIDNYCSYCGAEMQKAVKKNEL